jgi:formiminotetrahydrofolate cyclodeaminase
LAGWDITMADAHVSSDASIRDFLTALASADAAHGAVSAAAVAGGMGISLLLMVAALPTTRSDSSDSNADRNALIGASTGLSDVREQLFETIETETAVKIYAARQMPRASTTQQAQREEAIQLALRAAADVPLEVIRLCARGLEHARTVAACSCRAAASEVELAVALLGVGFTGARSNLETRLSNLTDVLYAKTVVEEIARLSEEVTRAAHAAEASVRIPPA